VICGTCLVYYQLLTYINYNTPTYLFCLIYLFIYLKISRKMEKQVRKEDHNVLFVCLFVWWKARLSLIHILPICFDSAQVLYIDGHDITEILVKMALNNHQTNKQTNNTLWSSFLTCFSIFRDILKVFEIIVCMYLKTISPDVPRCYICMFYL
jgi:hypothetical protein